ncbi:TetR/AcrR family transcriptional regulator, partial [Microbispora sp. NPDC049633]|uniref:TetR/AcrR family transcriptional regulator n=1 Tax=Microbispora sp. NPDC049633 TaxID=3154355 RepID=UPI00344953A6
MPRPKTIDRAAIVAAALDVADADGVASVSMHTVARRLAVTPMALYRHVANKADLLDGVVELLMAEIMDDVPAPEPAAGRDAWLDALVRTADRARAVASR